MVTAGGKFIPQRFKGQQAPASLTGKRSLFVFMLVMGVQHMILSATVTRCLENDMSANEKQSTLPHTVKIFPNTHT